MADEISCGECADLAEFAFQLQNDEGRPVFIDPAMLRHGFFNGLHSPGSPSMVLGAFLRKVHESGHSADPAPSTSTEEA